MAGTEQELEEVADYELDGPSLIAAAIPLLLESDEFLTALSGSAAFITKVCKNPLFVANVATVAGNAAGAVITQGLSR